MSQGENDVDVRQSTALQQRLVSVDRVLCSLQDGSARFATTRTPEMLRRLWASPTPPSLDDITKVYSPPCLQAQFTQLYKTLAPCLLPKQCRHETVVASTASAVLQGPRGSGKSCLLQHCLRACQDAHDAQQLNEASSVRPSFRVVRLHGRLLSADQSVRVVVDEILQQLYQIAVHEQANDNDTKQSDSLEQLLRLKRTTFTNHLQLLNDIIKLSLVDEIPILFVLDELDAFCGGGSTATPAMTAKHKKNHSSNRGCYWETLQQQQNHQLLLYHLLDRVQQPQIALVGLSCHQAFLTLLEKRIRSRLEGTTTFVQIGPPASYGDLCTILRSKLHDPEDPNDYICNSVSELIESKETSENVTEDSAATNDECTLSSTFDARIPFTLERNWRLGQSVRWMLRVFDLAISLYRAECLLQANSVSWKRQKTTNESNVRPQFDLPLFRSDYIIEALVDMGARVWKADTKEPDASRLDVRTQLLTDLAEPQVALVLAARRLLVRASHGSYGTDRTAEETAGTLSLDRLLQEYRTASFRAPGGEGGGGGSRPPRGRNTAGGITNRYSSHILTRAFLDLLDLGVFRPAMDHSGIGPFQYDHQNILYDNLDGHSLGQLPLHLTFDVYQEIQPAIDQNIIEASTALLAWGKNIH